jgi:hypothetical protein
MKHQDQRPEGLAVWESAMETARVAQVQLDAARARGATTLIPAMRREVEILRTRADLVLADAIKAMHSS